MTPSVTTVRRLQVEPGGTGGDSFAVSAAAPADGQVELASLVRRQLDLLGEDPGREGLLRTPERVAKSLAWLMGGYDTDARDVIGEGVFDETHEGMVMVRDIEMYSMCEHHMLPFFGKVHVAYIPDGRIVGLSKLPRIVDEDHHERAARAVSRVPDDARRISPARAPWPLGRRRRSSRIHAAK